MHLMYHCQQNKCYPIPRFLSDYTRFQPRRIYLPIIIKVKIVIATKFHYRVLQLTAVFLTPLEVTFILLAMVYLIENFTYAYKQFNVLN